MLPILKVKKHGVGSLILYLTTKGNGNGNRRRCASRCHYDMNSASDPDVLCQPDGSVRIVLLIPSHLYVEVIFQDRSVRRKK